MTSESLDRILAHVNDLMERASHDDSLSPNTLAAEIATLKSQAAHLVRFLAGGGDSALIQGELSSLEAKIAVAERDLAAASKRRSPARYRPTASAWWPNSNGCMASCSTIHLAQRSRSTATYRGRWNCEPYPLRPARGTTGKSAEP